MSLDCYELVERVGGEIVRGQARLRQGRTVTVLGKLNGDRMEFTEEGRKMAAEYDKPKRGRKPKTTVEDLTNTAEQVSQDTGSGLGGAE
jgi:hypothetical protein